VENIFNAHTPVVLPERPSLPRFHRGPGPVHIRCAALPPTLLSLLLLLLLSRKIQIQISAIGDLC
jgi:hypothetical protein